MSNSALLEPIRDGASFSLRRDLYHALLGGPLWRLLALLFCAGLTLNLVFAGLYFVQPGSISGARPGSFLDAFFFSVQTMSTIGYGAMSPATTWANLLVAVEAACGMIGIGLVSGLVFARASRPVASVMFSERLVISERHGVPTLMLRLGNSRGNEIVKASVQVTAMIEETSAEGHALRRLIDLDLIRSETPFFRMTWTVMHEIDSSSPLCGLEAGDVPGLRSLIVLLIGHDGTYGQTIYDRHLYRPEDIRRKHRLVDVLTEHADGRLHIDYHTFHDIEAE